MSNLLKRKNDDESSTATDQLTKRVALDSEQLELTEKQEETAHTAPHIQRQADPSMKATRVPALWSRLSGPMITLFRSLSQ